MKRRILKFDNRPANPHTSAGVEVDGWLYISGQGPLDFEAGKPVAGTIEEETQLTMQHIEKILSRAGCSLEDVVKCTCFLGDLADFDGFNRTYQQYFSTPVPPARTTVQALLLGGIKIEIDVIAKIPGKH